MQTVILHLAQTHPIAALWLAGLARLELGPELLRAATRVYSHECGQA